MTERTLHERVNAALEVSCDPADPHSVRAYLKRWQIGDDPPIDYRACRWGISNDTLYVATPLELAEEIHALGSGGFDPERDVRDLATDPPWTVVRLLGPPSRPSSRDLPGGDPTFLFSTDLRDDAHFHGDRSDLCIVITLCDATGDVKRTLWLCPTLLTRDSGKGFVRALRAVTGLDDLHVSTWWLRDAIRTRSDLCGALIEVEGRCMLVVERSSARLWEALAHESDTGRVLDPRTLHELARSGSDVRLGGGSP